MSKKTVKTLATAHQKQRAFLVGVEFTRKDFKPHAAYLTLEASLDELELLCKTAGLDVVGQMTQKLESPNPATFIGSGKVEELMAWKEAEDFDIVVFDDELSPRHHRELEELLKGKVQIMDRTALILDIFAQHARTREGALQVELAQYQYRMPRLTRMWTHLARQAGGAAGRSGNGGVGVRGPGETQLEIDQRLIQVRMSKLKAELEHVKQQRGMQRQHRRRAEVPTVAIVGYTNAGKSTLLNALSNANVLAEDKLFATLDPTTRKVKLPRGHECVVTDTVGFIQKLPTQLVAAFRATLEETIEADALLHVVDATHPDALEQARTVMDLLADLGAGDKQMIFALNKCDREFETPDASDTGQLTYPLPEAATGILSEGIPVSARKRVGLEALLSEIEAVLYERLVSIKLNVPYSAGDAMALIRRHGVVDAEEPGETSTFVQARVPGRLVPEFKAYLA